MFKKRFMPLFDADGGSGGSGGTSGGTGGDGGSNSTTVEIDYEKLASIINGKQKVAEETVLKNYFKEQGLSKEQMDDAIKAFKAKQKENKPDVEGLTKAAEDATKEKNEALIKSEALMMCTEIGVDLKTMPYVIKMANLEGVIEEGKINNDKLKEALAKVLEDIPQLKKSEENNNNGFREIGGNGGNGGQGSNDELLRKAFGLK